MNLYHLKIEIDELVKCLQKKTWFFIIVKRVIFNPESIYENIGLKRAIDDLTKELDLRKNRKFQDKCIYFNSPNTP